MPEVTLQQAFELALQQHLAGNFAEAESIYRQILAVEPDQPDTLHYLGVMAHQVGQQATAIELIGKALGLRPPWPEALNNYGLALKQGGRSAEAITAFRQAIALNPEFAEAHNNLGLALKDIGEVDQASTAYQQAIALKPDYFQSYNNLGLVLHETGKLDQAIVAFQTSIALKPDFAEAHNNLGCMFKERGDLDQALLAFKQAVALQPDYAQAYDNLGCVLMAKGSYQEAIAAHRQAITLQPGSAEAHHNLGALYHEIGQLDQASGSYRQALALKPNLAETYFNLGIILKDQGQLDEALAALRQATALRQANSLYKSNYLLTLLYHPAYDAATIAAEHQQWNQQYAEPLRHLIPAHENDRSPERRLRVGYVSPDFYNHAVGYFMLPLLAHHNRQDFEIFAYAQVSCPDIVTEQLRAHTDVWRNTSGLSDEQVTEQIRADRIDILVDLAMHTGENRLLVFARKPAPVQVNYLAYVGSSGLTTMDYRLSDPYLDPPGKEEANDCEQLVRLPETYWCYRPFEIDLSPARERETKPTEIRFGCLNNFCKINDPLLRLWAKILQKVPGSRLVLHAHQGGHRQRLLDRITELGIDSQRVEFVRRLPRREYFQTYQSLDITLDTTPYAGGTTTCDSLWMGVPVVTLAGERAVGRSGVSILSNVGLPELIARTPEEYIQIAVDLALDLPRLRQLRSTLRERLENSPIMDAPKFVRNLEAAYRQMWRTWCESKTP